MTFPISYVIPRTKHSLLIINSYSKFVPYYIKDYVDLLSFEPTQNKWVEPHGCTIFLHYLYDFSGICLDSILLHMPLPLL